MATAAADRPKSTCSEDGCDRITIARGLCTKDYQRRKEAGTLPEIPCPVPGCTNDRLNKGPCKTHRAEFESAGMWWCTAPTCSERLKPASDFPSNGQRLYAWCKPCNRAKTAEHHAKNNGYPGSHHRIDPDQYRNMLVEQDSKCAICRKRIFHGGSRSTVPCVDHDHSHCPGRLGCPECVRSLLCYGCNIMLAHDDPEILRRWKPTKKRPQELIDAAIAYLEYWHAEMARRGIRPPLEEVFWQDLCNALTRYVFAIAPA